MTDLPPPDGVPAPAPPPPASCHRHPGRPAGRRCTRCGQPACAQCLTQGPVGSICDECRRRARPAARQRARQWSAQRTDVLTRALIAVNVAVFAAMTLAEPDTLRGSRTALHDDLGLFSGWVTDASDWYRFLSSGFIHFGIVHLGFNMFLLFQLGRMLEGALGPVRFGLIYVAALLGGSAGALALQSGGLHGGASGAVFGLMGCAAVGFWQRGINPMNTGIGSLLLMNLLITFVVPGISIGGHLGGVVTGGIGALVLSRPTPRNGAARQIWALGGLCCLAAVACVVIANT